MHRRSAVMDGKKYGDGFGNLCCSFCGKNQREVKKLIAGPTVYICDECIELCNDIIAEEGQREAPAPSQRLQFQSPTRSSRRSTNTSLDRIVPSACSPSLFTIITSGFNIREIKNQARTRTRISSNFRRAISCSLVRPVLERLS